LNRASKQLLIDFTFHTLQFERVEFKIDSRNIKSRKAVEKLGATFEGELRSHTLMNDGYRRSTVYYGILKDEWDK
jgi:RimJ/RimL family protein N-acetyltransferase